MSNPSGRPRVLIVEDEESHQEIYEEVLADDYHLRITATKEAAIRCLREESFDVALVDMRLNPDDRNNREGLDVAEFIRDLGLPTAIILKSGFPTETPEVTARVHNLKIFAVLDKSTEGQVKLLRQQVAQAVAVQRSK